MITCEKLFNFIYKEYFLYNIKYTNFLDTFQKEYKLIVFINQWLNKNPEYNLEKLIDFIIELEEDFLLPSGKSLNEFNTEIIDYNKKDIFYIRISLFIQYLRDIPVYNYMDTFYLDQFLKDEVYFNLTKKVIEFLNKDLYDELELYKFLKPLRRIEFKQYNWKSTLQKESIIERNKK